MRAMRKAPMSLSFVATIRRGTIRITTNTAPVH
jgi:hypothetical protein